MKKGLIITTGIAGVILLSGWGSSDSNVTGDKKHSINFYGTLETWANQGTFIKVDNISIDNLFKQIPMFLRPSPPKMNKKKTSAIAADAAKAAKKAAHAAHKAVIAAKKGDHAASAAVAKAAHAAASAATEAAQALLIAIPKEKTTNVKIHVLEKDPKKSLIEAKIDLAEVGEIHVPFPDEIWIYQKEKGHRKNEYIEMTIISRDLKKTKMHYLIEKRKKIYCDRKSAAGPAEQEVPIEAVKSLKIAGYKDRELEKSEKRRAEERKKIEEFAKKAG